MRVIGQADIRRAVTMRVAIDAAREAFVALSTGQAQAPLRAHLATAGGTMLVMPGYARPAGAAGLKLVSVNPDNPARGLPTVQAVVLLASDQDGTPRALLEGTLLTQIRTGAAIGLGAELLALPDADIVALFGAGATARTSLWAICTVRPVREVRVVHPHAERFPAFLAAMRELLGDACPTIRRVDSAAEALAGARIVVTATTSPVPLFPGELLEPGAYIGALGAYTPETRELDTTAVLRARLVVDSRAAALAEAGEVCLPIAEGAMTAAHIWAEIGEIAAGLRPGRTAPDELILFKSVGNAVQDLVLAARVLRAVEAGDGGRAVSLE
jgi:ornithine cyclodeaminase/alanine dehydrogenase-like protein (mu-crystallin family)